jgi:hypothetical protein
VIARTHQECHAAAVPYLNCFRGLFATVLLTVTLAFKVSGQTNQPLEILATDATNYMNQEVIVTDTVVQVTLRPTVALLNLNRRYPDSPLTLVIRGNDTNKFPALESYFGRQVAVSGRIFDYQGRPEIMLTETNQIRILNAAQPIVKPVPPTLALPPPATATDQPANAVTTNSPPIVPGEVKPVRAVGWIVVMFGVTMVLLGCLVILFWRRGVGHADAPAPQATLALLASAEGVQAEPSSAEEWRQRALVAEAMAGRQGQILREKLMPELAEFAKQSLVQGLYAQRNALIETQQAAQRALGELESRLAALQLPLPERIRAYERRIAELEKEVETQGAEMRELTRATLVLVRKKLEEERKGERTPSRFN